MRYGIQTLSPKFFGGAPDIAVAGFNVGCKTSISFPPSPTLPLPSRQTGKYPPQPLQHDRLLRRLRINLVHRLPNTNASKAPGRSHNRTLTRQPRRPARTHIPRRDRRSGIDPREDKPEIGRRGTSTRGGVDGGEIDIEPDVRGEVRFRSAGEGLRDVCGEGGVDGDVRIPRRGVGVVGGLGARGAAEGDGGDAFLRGLGGGADGSGEEDCEA